MSKIVEQVVVKAEDMNRLEKAFYKVQALKDLMKEDVINEPILARYEKVYEAYNKIWTELVKTYLSKDYSTLGKEYNQNADFATCTITITKE